MVLEVFSLRIGIAKAALYVGRDGEEEILGMLEATRFVTSQYIHHEYSTRVVNYSGTYSATGPGYLAMYGWTRNPLIEFYIVDAHADLSPNEPWISKGNFTSEEGAYEVFESTRVNQPSIEGTRTFQQYWSVRHEQRVGGKITLGKHFDEWAKLGMKLGAHEYVVLAVEGYTATGGPGSSGSASITLG
jgi:endo-1,4-beta-xylanase